MKKWISILSGLLVVQLVLAMAINLTGEDYGVFLAEERLLAFEQQAVDGLRIEGGTDSVVLKKQGGQWSLPESGDFPASQGSVEGLLDKLATLEKGWPVATTGGAARHFKVAEGQFEQKLVLLSGDDVQATLYVGSSPGFRKVHVRSGDEDEVYAAAFNAWEANAKTDDWIDKSILKLNESDVEHVEMPAATLQRKEDQLQVIGLEAQEQTDEKAVRSLIGKLTGLRIQSLLGTEAKPEYRQDEPVLDIEVARKGSDMLSYHFSKPKEGAYFVLKRSDLDHYFKVAESTVKPILDTAREKLVQAKTQKASNEAAGEKQSEETTETVE